LEHGIKKKMPFSNYVYNIPYDYLVRSKHVAEEAIIIHDNVAHHHQTTKNCRRELKMVSLAYVLLSV
jgi:hypothetical protein